MRFISRTLAACITALALSVSGAAAKDGAAPERLEFSQLSTQSSGPVWYPAWVIFGLGSRIDDRSHVRGGSGQERVLTDDAIDNLRFELGWALGGSSAASSAASSAFGDFTPYIVAGAILASHDVRALVNSGGSVFPTDGDSEFRGLYTGLNVKLVGRQAQARSAASSAAVLIWNAFFNLGWGRGEVEAFNGTFRQSDTGLFWEVGTSLQVDLGGVYFGPDLTHRRFDQSNVKFEDTVIGLRFTVPLE